MDLYSLISANSKQSNVWISEVNGRRMSFADFFHEVDMAAQKLSSYFSVGDVVVVDMEKNISTIALLFACIKLKLGFCFLDRSAPFERRKMVVNLVQPRVIFSDRSYTDFGYQATDITMLSAANIIASGNRFTGNFIFTSGSTGVPKGVKVSASALAYYVDSMIEVMPGKTGTWLSIAPLHFDLYQLDFLVQFARGLNIVIAESGLLPQQIMNIIKEEDISELVAVSTVLKMFSVVYPTGAEQCNSITKIYYGGEGCPISVLNSIATIFPKASFCQFYGPTENTNNTTYYHFEVTCDTGTGFMPLGKPLKHVIITLISDDNKLIHTPFVEGEITIGGNQLMDGYMGLKLKDHTNFSIHSNGVKVYRTGDYGFLDDNGLLWFKGRKDDLVKIRGNRISLLEVEAQLLRCMSGSGHVLATTYEVNGFESLIAGVSSTDGIDIPTLKGRLLQYLPVYAVPEKIVAIDINQIEVLSTGKLDRNKFKSRILELTGE